MGFPQTITWSTSGPGCGSHVAIELFRGSNSVRTISWNEVDDGSMTWNVPVDLAEASDYRIKISDKNDPSRYDFSDTYFSLAFNAGVRRGAAPGQDESQ